MKAMIISNLIKFGNSTVKFLGVLIATAFLFGCNAKTEKQSPNIIFILADDLGTEVLGSYGGTSYETPNLDKLAETGTRFTQCYSNPVCSPSRVRILTGRYGFRTGQKWGYIPENEITFGQLLRDNGYKTAISGKWQMALLKDKPNHIKQMGFDESCVFGWHEGPRYHEPLIYKNGKTIEVDEGTYGPDVYYNFLIEFIKKNKNEKFFAYYSMTLAHEISNDFSTPPPFGPLGRYQSYKELVEDADRYIGKLMADLDELDLLDNTLVVFTGDNGTPHHFITKYEDGKYIKVPIVSAVGDSLVPGGKSYLTDAGTHVPLITNWKNKNQIGIVNNDLIDFSDFYSTFCDLAEIKLPNDRPIDGISFLPQIIGEEGNIREWAYTEWEGAAWIRNERWKLYKDERFFDMKNDPLELNPIAVDVNDSEINKNRNFLKKELSNLLISNIK